MCSARNDRPGRTGVRTSERQDGLHPLPGGLVLCAPAWRVEARKKLDWLERASAARTFAGVDCQQPFLIRPCVRVPNLASHPLEFGVAAGGPQLIRFLKR